MKRLRPAFLLLILLAFAGASYSQQFKIDPKDQRDGPKVKEVFRPVVAKPSEATVRVSVDGKDVAYGVIVEPDGWIITKWSVVEDKRDKSITVKLKNGTVHKAEIKGVKDEDVKMDKDEVKGAYDLVMLKIDAKDLPTVQWRDSKEAKVGKWVASVGIGADPVAVGVVSVATRKYKLGDQPLKFANFDSGYLGVQLADAMGGVRVTIITPKSPAQKAGLKIDDIIYEAAGRRVGDVETLINTIGRFKAGEKVLLKLKRGEEDLEITATLAERPKELKGNPQETMGTKLSVRRGGFPVILQHDSGVRPEDCGGPLVDLDGKAVGINIARAGRTETFAIPAEDIQKLIPDLKSGKLMPKAIVFASTAHNPDLTLTRSLSVTDKLTRLKADEKLEKNHFMKVEEFQFKEGVTYVIEMKTTDKTLDPYLILEDAKGKELARDDDSGGFPNAKIVFRAPKDGVYRIVCTSFNPDETGSYTLSVHRQQKQAPKDESKK